MPGHIIAVVGGKGGVGKSVFAANLTVAYLQQFKQRPLLVDLDLASLGDQNLILGLNPSKSIVEVSKMPAGVLDPKALSPYMLNAQAGFSFIGAPRDAIIARDLDLEGLGKFLKAVTNVFNIVVVDCGSSMDAHVIKTFEFATAIFVVTSADLIVVNQTRRILGKIQEFLFPQDMVQVILNRYSPTSLISPQVIQKNIGRNIFAAIPEEASNFESALAQSSPLCLSVPNSTAGKSFHEIVRKIQQTNLLENLAKLKKPVGAATRVAAQSALSKSGGGGEDSGQKAAQMIRSTNAPVDAWTAMKMRIHKSLLEKMDLKKQSTDQQDPKQIALLREKTQRGISEVLETEDTASLLPSRELKAQIIKEVLDEALGLGPLEDLLADDSVTEIMVNSRDQIYIERAGRPALSKVTFTSEAQMMNVIERIVTPLGRRVDGKSPYVDARLADGSRVHIIIPPLALRGPTITIRKFPKRRMTHKDLIDLGTVNDEIMDFLRCCVEAALSMVVSGGTGSGKTTILNVLSNFIPTSERIITVEDSAELQLAQEHVVRLETRGKNIEGEGEVTIRDLVKCCLRMRPNRIVVGECRSGEAIDMLQAMNTGHNGSLTTIHANSPRECLGRLETLVMMAGLGLPSKAIRETIASAVNLVVQISRLADGSRKVTHISEITGIQGDVISLQDIFLFKQEGMDKRRRVIGKYIPTGFVPKFVEELENKGLRISRGLFTAKVAKG